VEWKYFRTAGEALQELRRENFAVYAVEQAEGSIPLHAFNSEKPVALVFGNEVTGVEQSTILLCDGCLEIPQMGMKHSLNVATAAGVVLWEMVRHRLHTGSKTQGA
jgi:tRNA G18 (ribose-2'-O)-methylase SpoU